MKKVKNKELTGTPFEGELPPYEPLQTPSYLPTPSELAVVAATLARNIEETPEVLTDKAMKLWLSSRERILVADHAGEIDEQDDALIDYFSRPSKIFVESARYPVTRDEFLEKVFPQYKGRADKLAQIGKAYLHYKLGLSGKWEETLEAVSKVWGSWAGYQTAESANTEAEIMLAWYKDLLRQKRRTAGEKSAKGRKIKKSL